MPCRSRACELPPLAEVCPRNPSTIPVNKTAHVEAELRRIAVRHRADQRLRFYTMDEVAGHFPLSKSLVSRVFKTLQNEGLLRIHRGAHTWLLPRPSRRKAPLSGILALATWFPGLAELPDWRIFLRQFEQSARKHGIACYSVLYEHLEDSGDEFFTRIRQYQPDWFVWMYPVPPNRETLLKLNDAGIASIIMTRSERVLPDQSPYFMDYAKQATALFRAWKNDGVQSARIYADSRDSLIENGDWKKWIQAAGLKCTFTDLKSDILPEAPSGDPREGIIFQESYGTSLLLRKWKHQPNYWRNQHFLLNIRTDMREVTCAGTVPHLYGMLPDWKKSAEIILDGLADPAKKKPVAPTPLPVRTFQAKSLNEFDFSILLSRPLPLSRGSEGE